MGEEEYGAAYWTTHCGPIPYGRTLPWLQHFGRIANEIMFRWRPRTVWDVGCGWGLLVEALRDRGIAAGGCDLSAYALAQARPDIRPYLQHASLLTLAPRRVDLVCAIEVLEHLPAADARPAVQRLTAWAPRVLFSASPDDVTEPTHRNVQPPAYWDALFAEQGYGVEEAPALWVSPWARVYVGPS